MSADGRRGTTKKKLKTSQEVWNRLRWDPRFDERTFVIGYEGRFEGIQEVPLPEFSAARDIPWHRVRYIKGPAGLVWDRARRLDRVFGSGDTAAEDVLVVEQEAPSRGGGGLGLLSYNVLFDCYDDVDVRADERWPCLLDTIAADDADIIALQEVTPSFLELLLQRPALAGRHRIGGGRPFGQLLLAKEPLEAIDCDDRRLLIGRCREITFGVVHLISNHRGCRRGARKRQLATLLELVGAGPAVLLGDWNFADESEAAPLIGAGFRDAWVERHGDGLGHSFDVSANLLAARTSRTGRSGRLDRIYLRLPARKVETIELLGRQAIEGVEPPLFLSDHYGLRCCLQAIEASALESKPVHQSALAVIPPRWLWPAIQVIRRQYDRSYERWPPHINVLYGFLPEEEFAAASKVLAPLLADQPSFELTLASLGRFEHGRSATVWLEPRSSPAMALDRVQQLAARAFPGCREGNGKGARRADSSYQAHLTIGQCPPRESLPTHQPPALTFEVEELAMISRRDDEPFARRMLVPLGKAMNGEAEAVDDWDVLFPAPTLTERCLREEAADELCAICRRAAGEAVITGSTLLGTARADSDIDVLALGPASMERPEFIARLEKLVTGSPKKLGGGSPKKLGGGRLRDVADAIAPVLSFDYGDFSVDVAYARMPKGMAPGEPTALTARERDGLDDDSRLAVTGYLNTLVLTRHGGQWRGFRKLVRVLRGWARRRGIDDHAVGYPGGFAWTLLASWVVSRHRELEGHELVRAAFTELASHDWSRPVALGPVTDGQRSGRPGQLQILTPCPPIVSCVRNGTASSTAIVITELAMAAAAIEGGRYELLDRPPDQDEDHRQQWPTVLTLEVSSLLWGQLRRRVLSLVLELEQLTEGVVRPWSEGTTLYIALARDEHARAASAACRRFEQALR